LEPGPPSPTLYLTGAAVQVSGSSSLTERAGQGSWSFGGPEEAVRIAGVVLGVVTVAALDLIPLIGAGGEPPPWFGALVLAMDLSLIVSSVALGVAFHRRGGAGWGCCSSGTWP
jgi:hypothetical protein